MVVVPVGDEQRVDAARFDTDPAQPHLQLVDPEAGVDQEPRAPRLDECGVAEAPGGERDDAQGQDGLRRSIAAIAPVMVPLTIV